MTNIKRELHVIEETERQTPVSEGANAGKVETPAAPPAETPAPTGGDGFRGVPAEEYLTGASIGANLRQARIKSNLEIDDVVKVLRIRGEYLRALEEGNAQALPGPAYAIGFVRAYAQHLGIDGEDAVQRFKAETEGLDTRTNLVFPTPAAEARLPGTAILIGSVVVAVVAYGAWYFLFSRDAAPTVAETPAVAADTAKPGTEPGAKPAEPPRMAAPVTPVEEAPAPAPPAPAPPVPAPVAEAPTVSVPEPQPAVIAPSAPEPQETARAADGTRIVISAVAESWVQVRDAEGAVIFTKLLRPGETYNVPVDQSGLTLLAGNAGAVRIRVDGKMLPAPGALGEVRRNISLDADKLLAGANN